MENIQQINNTGQLLEFSSNSHSKAEIFKVLNDNYLVILMFHMLKVNRSNKVLPITSLYNVLLVQTIELCTM